jgi:HK97 family phage major capsid protein
MPPAPIPIRQPLGRLASAAGLGSARFSPVVRAVLASAKSVFEPDRNAYRVARAAWPGDRQTLDFVTRAASTPATTTGTGWAAEIAHTVVEDLLVSLGPASAGSELLRRGTVLTFDGAAKLSVPSLVAAATNAGFVGQLAPIPVRQLSVNAGASLEPHKFATIVTLSREMIDSSNAEQLVRLALVDSLAAALDVALFGTTAGDATRPPGLLYGVTPITAKTGGGFSAVWADIAAVTW